MLIPCVKVVRNLVRTFRATETRFIMPFVFCFATCSFKQEDVLIVLEWNFIYQEVGKGFPMDLLWNQDLDFNEDMDKDINTNLEFGHLFGF